MGESKARLSCMQVPRVTVDKTKKKNKQKTVVWALMLAEDGRYVINLLTNFPWKPEERKSIDAVSERAPADSVICLAVLPFLL